MKALWLSYVSGNQSFFTGFCGGLKLSLKVAFPRGLCPGSWAVGPGPPGWLLERDWGAQNRGTRSGRAAPAVPRDICDLSGQPASLQLFLYSCDLPRRREGKGKEGKRKEGEGVFLSPCLPKKVTYSTRGWWEQKTFDPVPTGKGCRSCGWGGRRGCLDVSSGPEDEVVTWSTSGCRWPCHQYRVMAPWRNPQKAK